jgi:hypothetical protein
MSNSVIVPGAPDSDLRAAIVAAAAGEIGLVVSDEEGAVDPDTGRTFRLGHDRLEEYFAIAWGEPGQGYELDAIRYLDTGKEGARGLVSWCGIFALWCLRTGGVCHDRCWRGGVGINPGLPWIHHPQPGDIGYIEHLQHHCVVESISDDGNEIVSIDGNSGGNGSIQRRTRQRSEFHTFFRAL